MNWGRNQLAVVNSSVTPLSEPFSWMFFPPASACCSLQRRRRQRDADVLRRRLRQDDGVTAFCTIPVGAVAFSNTTIGEVCWIITPGESLSATFAETHCAARLL